MNCKGRIYKRDNCKIIIGDCDNEDKKDTIQYLSDVDKVIKETDLMFNRWKNLSWGTPKTWDGDRIKMLYDGIQVLKREVEILRLEQYIKN
ncbi:MAG: hypothetical protein HGA35_02720 [Erysipelotrichaceae bacterium]|nr:hypothetical protein [Erysipelotrichaceae bacterium]